MCHVEADLAETVRPGWLSRWETTSRHLTLGKLIGLGRFGQVIQGTLHTPGGETISVAAKSVRRKNAQCYRNFYREAAILVTVHEDEHHNNAHSNIIQLLGLINETSQKYILMEYASKGSLLRLLRHAQKQNGAAPLEHGFLYAVDIARALRELQRLAITHGDVAARNVLITADHVAKLADFGLGRDVYAPVKDVDDDDKNRENMAENEFIPLNWMSVEVLERGEYTCQSDVWSFGVLLWEIATLGQEPHYGGNPHDNPSCLRLARTLRRGIRLRRPPECSGEMYDVMMSCWHENPSERPSPDEVETRLLRLTPGFEMETVV
ncbi:fibroblast growth factor receptor 4-like [Branchiostoma floridae]|uniref:Fibroblast growth factor receptor 4-like n=1 Tax=Branchiostoma floridae TaxID=7739 RepID=A0A9J7LID6_BRAFL|nr:fibroblast growth factor receptor 4-like [Branchiostoma floridae]